MSSARIPALRPLGLIIVGVGGLVLLVGGGDESVALVGGIGAALGVVLVLMTAPWRDAQIHAGRAGRAGSTDNGTIIGIMASENDSSGSSDAGGSGATNDPGGSSGSSDSGGSNGD